MLSPPELLCHWQEYCAIYDIVLSSSLFAKRSKITMRFRRIYDFPIVLSELPLKFLPPQKWKILANRQNARKSVGIIDFQRIIGDGTHWMTLERIR